MGRGRVIGSDNIAMGGARRASTYAVCQSCSAWLYHHRFAGNYCKCGQRWPASELSAAAFLRQSKSERKTGGGTAASRKVSISEETPATEPQELTQGRKQQLFEQWAKEFSSAGSFKQGEIHIEWAKPLQEGKEEANSEACSAFEFSRRASKVVRTAISIEE